MAATAARHLASAGFTAVSLANNHAGDLGAPGVRDTRRHLAQAGISAVDLEGSPLFARVGDVTIAIIAVSIVPDRAGRRDTIPSDDLRRRLRLGRRLAHYVAVSVHWGKELAEWTSASQRAQARWLIGEGADLVVGHHPHVVQPPACVDGKPVFYSLGNFVFDQKFPAARQGQLADCRVWRESLSCAAVPTAMPVSGYGSVVDFDEARAVDCAVAPSVPLSVGPSRLSMALEPGEYGFVSALRLGGRPLPSASAVLSVDAARLAPGEEPSLFALERHPSPLDGENAPRPYVYTVQRGRVGARWRGSGLAWPLVDATLVDGGPGGALLCALHRGDSFVVLDPETTERRIAAYRWNGFGFDLVRDGDWTRRCKAEFVREL